MAARGFTALVVGGGVAGATTALCLARRGLSALVVESSTYEDFRVGDTLPPIARVLLERLGLWERFEEQKHVPSQTILSAWGGAELAEQHSLFSPLGTGWHLDRSRFDAMVAAAAEEHGAVVLRASRVKSLSGLGPFRACIAGPAEATEVEAQFIVDATGRASSIARQLGSERVAYDRLVGVLALLNPTPGGPAPAPFLLLESVAEGWWYSVPLPSGALLVAAMVDADAIPRSGLRPLEYWKSLLITSHHTRLRTAALRAPESVIVRKAATERLSRIAGPSFLAVGDAATSYDPLSSQGICKALMTGELAAQAIEERVRGEQAAFSLYEQRVAAELSRFFADRGRYYAVEKRWPDSLFWRRRIPADPRDRALSLDPLAILCSLDCPFSAPLVAQLEGTLPLGEIERLYELCRTPAAAHQILACFQDTARVQVPFRDVLAALQGLVRNGAILCQTSSSQAAWSR